MPASVLSFDQFPSFVVDELKNRFDFHYNVDKNDTAAMEKLAPAVRAVVAKGETIFDDALMARLPKLEIIALCSVGYDGVDLAAARRRGIAVTNTPDVLTDDVADLAIALMLSVARGVVGADQHVRRGAWPQGTFPLTRKVSGGRLGVVGLGRIGQAIAKRAEAFGMSIAYTARSAKPEVAYTYYPTPQALAKDVDFLVVATVGGQATRGLISAEVLEALGPKGYLINVARGSVVDEAALVKALADKRIAGAGLDVFADEPNVPAALIAMDNVVLTPHMGSGTVDTRTAMGKLACANLSAHFAGEPLLTPIPA